ncbi:hypothetical protein CSKR_112530 [Clonorchis sinensis]|uniref:Uncharacterized protein n=2 Tax=Clonorchis sinensis TaxID=79923 RepID=A0A8T1MUZ1_CLOSI|nr:hypothetical protein CSKR_112530 [Clonorchis sinensis]GAA32515.2 cell wall protein Awa1p [Clonorchis sinensis]
MPELPDSDPFEEVLLATDFLSDADLTRLEEKLGLAGGGSWWLDPTQSPVELDPSGNVDQGAIVDVEAQTHAWLRASFDNNPDFREHNYHLLSRLTELARLKGLVEEVALKHHQGDVASADRADNNLFHSTLSLAVLGELDGLNSWQSGGYPPTNQPFDVHHSVEGPLGLRKNYGTYERHSRPSQGKRPQLPQAFIGMMNEGSLGVSVDSDTMQPLHPRNVFSGVPSTISPTISPKPKKSNLPPSPHYNQLAPTALGYTKRPPSRNSNRTRHFLAPPDATSSPDGAANGQQPSGLLNRTYSKEALDLLKEQDFMPARRSMGSVNSSLLKHFISRNGSGPLSDADSDVDVSRSVENCGLGVLSQSLTDAQFGNLRGSQINPNASYSSMRSTDVIELARMQEYKLRQHSGSRGKLNGSNSSLTGSLLGDDNLLRPDASTNRSQSSFSLSEFDPVRSSCDTGLLRHINPQSGTTVVDPSRSLDLTDRPPGPALNNRNNSALDVGETGRRPEALQLQTGTRINVELRQIPEVPTPNVAAANPNTLSHGVIPEPSTVTHKTKEPGMFFPDNVDETVQRERTNSLVPRLDSQTSFEQLEARVSQETFLLDQRSSADSDLQLTDSVTSVEGLIGTNAPEPAKALSNSSSSLQSSSKASSKESLLPSRPPSGLRPPSRLPAPVRRLPTPSLNPPTISSHPRPSTTAAVSGRNGPQSRQPMSQIQPQNSVVRNTSSDANKRSDTQLLASKTATVNQLPSRSSIRPPSRPTSGTRPQVSRSDASPVRSTSRRFGQHSNLQGTRRG